MEYSNNEQNESIWSVKVNPVYDEGSFPIHVTQPFLANGTLYKIWTTWCSVWWCLALFRWIEYAVDSGNDLQWKRRNH